MQPKQKQLPCLFKKQDENLDVNNLDKHCIMSDLEDEEVAPQTFIDA